MPVKKLLMKFCPIENISSAPELNAAITDWRSAVPSVSRASTNDATPPPSNPIRLVIKSRSLVALVIEEYNNVVSMDETLL